MSKHAKHALRSFDCAPSRSAEARRTPRLTVRRTVAAACAAATMGGVAAAVPPASASPQLSAGASSTSVGSQAVQVAARQAGKPYAYGAAGPNAFDCSGLTQYVYRQLGRNLPHSTAAQYAATRHVPPGSERPGDLIFFGAPNAYHVGVYAGGGQIWHAPHTGTVVRLARIWTSYSVGRVS